MYPQQFHILQFFKNNKIIKEKKRVCLGGVCGGVSFSYSPTRRAPRQGGHSSYAQQSQGILEYVNMWMWVYTYVCSICVDLTVHAQYRCMYGMCICGGWHNVLVRC